MSLAIIPTLHVDDINVAREFYENVLGFQVDWVWRAAANAPAFSQISYQDARVYLTERSEGGSGTLLHLYVENVDDWYRRLLANNIPVDSMPHDEAWGNREMQIRDPDGNYLRFCTPLTALQAGR